MKTLVWVLAAVLTSPLVSSYGDLRAQQPSSGSKVALDYEYFKTQVQPVFLTKRPGYTRCIVCHSQGGQVGFLQPLSPGATAWNEEESRKNFERVSKMVTPGEPLKSLLLRHPLEPAAGGDEFHNGGRQFTSQDDPQFKTIAAWVRGETSAPAR
jgi:mono/diheme cytochrome c family protein